MLYMIVRYGLTMRVAALAGLTMVRDPAHDFGQPVSQDDLRVLSRMHQGMSLGIEISRIHLFIVQVGGFLRICVRV